MDGPQFTPPGAISSMKTTGLISMVDDELAIIFAP
jgi:hypothetical protein